MRVCMVTTFYPPHNFGGDGIYVYRLSNALARRGHAVEVVHCADAYALLAPTPPGDAPPNEPGVVVHTLHSRLGPLSPLATQQTGLPVFKAKRLRAIIEQGRFDVIHFHNVSLIGAGALAYGPPSALRLYTAHEYWLVCPMHALWQYDRQVCERPRCLACQVAGRRPPQIWRATSLLGGWLRHVDAIIAPSRFSLRLHQELGRARGLPDLPLRHLPYFVPASEPAPLAAPPSPGPNARPYFLFVGRLERLKGLQQVIEVFHAYTQADLLVAGEGAYGDTLRALAAGLPHVHFLGRLPHTALRDLYAGAIATLVPSLWHEVFGIVILESFAAGTPVIAHDVGGAAEVIAESAGGLIYDSSEGLVTALERLRLDRGLRDQHGAAGAAAVHRLWSEEAHLRAYGALLGELARRKGVAPPDLDAGARSG